MLFATLLCLPVYFPINLTPQTVRVSKGVFYAIWAPNWDSCQQRSQRFGVLYLSLRCCGKDNLKSTSEIECKQNWLDVHIFENVKGRLVRDPIFSIQYQVSYPCGSDFEEGVLFPYEIHPSQYGNKLEQDAYYIGNQTVLDLKAYIDRAVAIGGDVQGDWASFVSECKCQCVDPYKIFNPETCQCECPPGTFLDPITGDCTAPEC